MGHDSKHFSFLGLLLSFVILFALIPFVDDLTWGGMFIRIGFTVVVFFSVYVVAEKFMVLLIALLLALPYVFIQWASMFDVSLTAQIIRLTFVILLYAYVAVILLTYIFKTKVVNANVIYGAICVYILLGLIWSIGYVLTEVMFPGSFSGLPTLASELSIRDLTTVHHQSLFYYSYVTLTTLGYGNIAPTTTGANALASAEAMVGQLYVAILIARLVGLHISQQKSQ